MLVVLPDIFSTYHPDDAEDRYNYFKNLLLQDEYEMCISNCRQAGLAKVKKYYKKEEMNNIILPSFFNFSQLY